MFDRTGDNENIPVKVGILTEIVPILPQDFTLGNTFPLLIYLTWRDVVHLIPMENDNVFSKQNQL